MHNNCPLLKSAQNKLSSREFLSTETKLITTNVHAALKLAVAFPNSYAVGMSSLGFQTVYKLFAEQNNVLVERAFVPYDLIHSNKIRSFESNKLLSEFDVVAVSVSFELDYLAVLAVLESAGLNLQQAIVSKHDLEQTPFIIGGGSALTLNPEPLACFFDAIVIGEAEEVIPQLMQVIKKTKDKLIRNEALQEFSRIRGVYVPSVHQDRGLVKPLVQRAYVKDINQYPTHSIFLTPYSKLSNMFVTEVSRGCASGCKFCAASYIYRPMRKRKRERIESTLNSCPSICENVGLLGTSVSAHPEIAEIAETARLREYRVSLSSLMSQHVTSELAEAIILSKSKSVALAPETGSEKLRFSIGKQVTDKQILNAAEILIRAGVKNIKLYFMIGLPGEEEVDVLSIANLCKSILDIATQKKHFQFQLHLSVNAFIPKAWTPFQWHPMTKISELKRKFSLLRKSVHEISCLKLKSESPKSAYIQTMLSRGGKRLAKLLFLMRQNKEDYASIFKKDLYPDFLLESLDEIVHRQFQENDVFPWDFIDMLISRKQLWKSYVETLADSISSSAQDLETKGVEKCKFRPRDLLLK